MGNGIMDFLFKKRIEQMAAKQLPKLVEKAMLNFTPAYSPTLLQGLPIYNNADTMQNIQEGYLTSDDVYSIVRRISRTAAMIPLTVYQVKDEKALKDYEFAVKQNDFSANGILRKEVLRRKSLQPVGDSDNLQMLLDNPNPIYSKNEFREGVHAFRLITGNTYLYTPLLELGPNKGKVAEMWLLPSQFMSLQVSQGFPREIISYRLMLQQLELYSPDEVIHLRYFNPNFSYIGNELIGLSPLKAGNKILTRQQAETDYSVNAFQNSGASGVVWYKGGGDMDEVTLGRIKDKWYTDTTGVSNAKKVMFSGAEVGYEAIGLSPTDMDMVNSEIRTFKKLCNLYGISDILFNNGEASTESNVKEMVKQLYTNAALPEVYAYKDALNSFLVPKFSDGKKKYYIDCDLSGITELQDDMKTMMEAFAAAPVMIPNVVLEAQGLGKQTDPLMDKVFIKQGYMPVEDAGSIGDLPLANESGT